MRALILLLSAVVVALAASIILYMGSRHSQPKIGDVFELHQLLANAERGEVAHYRDETTGRGMTWRVRAKIVQGMNSEPLIRLHRHMTDRLGQTLSGPDATAVYDHRVSVHGWFPLSAPTMPGQLERVWIVRGIRRDTLRWNGRERSCWRVDFIDPSLSANKDTVVGWYHTEAPVFGLLKWKRLDATWVLEASKAQ